MALVQTKITFNVKLPNSLNMGVSLTANDEGMNGNAIVFSNGLSYDSRAEVTIDADDYVVLRNLLNELIRVKGLEA